MSCIGGELLRNFLIATTEGLYRFDPNGEPEFVLLREGYAWKISLFEDHEGMLWVGTSGDGVERYNPKTGEWHVFDHNPDDPHSLSHDFVECILEDKWGVLWLGTSRGLNRFHRETETFTNYREKDGLVNDWVYGIEEDSQGYLWLSTARGISRFDPQTATFKNYLVNINPFNRNAHHQGKNGEIFFGGINGFNSFFPERIKDNPHIPPLVITKFSLFNQTVRTDLAGDEYIELNYKQNFLSFDFTALDYAAPEKNQFAYKMEGLDDDWVYIDTRRHVDYPDLKPGDYVFRVKGSNNDGIWNEGGTSVRITILPPFWLILWFRTAVVLLILLSAFFAYKRRINKIEAKKKELEIRVKEKTAAAQALQNALDEVERLKNRLQAENVYLQDEIRNVHNFENIITRMSFPSRFRRSEIVKKIFPCWSIIL